MLHLAYRVVRISAVVLACVILLALIQRAYKADFWSSISPSRLPALALILGVGGLAGAALIIWDMKREARRWSVTVTRDEVQVVDDAGITLDIPLADLRSVIATTSFRLWRNDIDLALFDDGDEALVSFPLLAAGADDFLAWVSDKRGYQPGELAKAKASARGGAFVIWSDY